MGRGRTGAGVPLGAQGMAQAGPSSRKIVHHTPHAAD